MVDVFGGITFTFLQPGIVLYYIKFIQVQG